MNHDDGKQEMKIGAVGEWCVGEPPVRWDVGLGARLAVHGRGSVAAVEPGRDCGRGGLAGVAVAAFAAWAGFGGHDLDGLEQGRVSQSNCAKTILGSRGGR